MTTLQTLTARTALPQATKTDDAAGATSPTEQQQQIAKDFPAGTVQVERSGLKLGVRIGGGVAAAGGATMLALALLPGRGLGRALMAPLVAGGGLVAAGLGSALGAGLLPPASQVAIATKIPTQAKAGEIAGSFSHRITQVVKTTDGTWAVIDEGPARGTSSPSYHPGHSYGDGHFHGQHYVGDGHYHDHGYYEPFFPEPDYSSPTPNYPRVPNGGYPGGRYPGGGTSSGDDRGTTPSRPKPKPRPPAYNPPKYDPPSYNPPKYNPPSYNNGNSTRNGNPSFDDF